jgi:hypothetical protein
MSQKLTAFLNARARFGTAAALRLALHHLVNTLIFFETMDIIVLERDRLRPLDPALTRKLTSRLATREDLEAMQAVPEFDIQPAMFSSLDDGDACLLSYADGKLAGYTWAHSLGRPELIPGLVINVPPMYLYNYAALTLPEFRGLGLQPYRHHQLLNSGLWQDRRGLLGYVFHTNFASRKGQGKSGYRAIGTIRLLGSRRHFVAWVSPGLRKLGIRRLPEAHRGPAALRSDRGGQPRRKIVP